MLQYQCRMCGGRIIPADDNLTGECDSCGSTSWLLSEADERKVNTYNRANALRMQGEFDKAAGMFESILVQYGPDPEIYWALVLCRYGIEYVEDPNTGERIPTCHRASYNSILTDVDYLAALEHADEYTAHIYRQEAEKIADIQKAILNISNKEEPYDVFICYKENTDGGSRTKDSVLAQDIYQELTKAGYKVFFARITLEDKLGVEYEPYIFAALNSAKVMLAVGTKPEHFNAVWVKNE